MTTWDEALESLSQREMSGKTAQVLIGAAEKMKEQNTEALRLMSLDYEAKIAKMADRIESAEAAASAREENAEVLRDALEAAHLENKRLTEPRRSVSVSGDTVDYTYQPGVVESGSSYEVKKWRLDELESALMHLRMAGAEDDTIVSANSIKASIPDTGQPVAAWSRPKAPPEVTEEELKRYKWARLRTWSIAGFIGFVIGGWIGMGIV